MDKKSKRLLILFGLLVLAVLVIETAAPPPLNWKPSYTSYDKIPFGSYVFYDQLDDLFVDEKVQAIDKDPVQFLKENDSVTNSNYLFINEYLGFDNSEVDDLLEFASRGNKIFISTKSVFGALADTLNIESNDTYAYYEEDTVRVRLNNQSFKNRSYIYKKGSSYRYFVSYDTTRTQVLGEVLPFEPIKGYLKNFIENSENESDSTFTKVLEDSKIVSKEREIPQANFIETKVGDGAIYHHLNPIAFTNYYMLQDGKEQYIAEVMSYMNDGPVFFDDYGKAGKRIIESPLRFILSNVHLRWAWYLALGSILLYFLFKSKREQRAVPVVEPLENSTLSFTRTISNMYLEKSDYSSIVSKKIRFFLEHVRSHYYIPTDKLDQQFIKKLSVKTGKSLEETTQFVQFLGYLMGKGVHNKYELKQLNDQIDAFLK
ncbi:DUF4350 domain-containing protein [Nonlabens tegetincola]|uniref:DUF4350 domain-containing protein n=1 Tax=Nonlabens tegetincola TaxID=323273 RepID=UPI000CF45B77|nr:DUF4350 domain-containing protein [Nonlabens tegetincola]PQJ19407.1 hypothetical protein BST93_06535 [Nonlabens tegetincola]